jgi:predicted O-linked N-acetylglucosamine transferase (SPINDLY family)
MDTESTQPAVDALALAMMNSFGQLSLILAHMHRYQAEGRSAPDALEPPFALAELLKQVLAELADTHAATDIATAAQMLATATRIIGDEIFVVDLERLREAGRD